MNKVIPKYQVEPRAVRDEEKAEKLALRASKAAMQEIVDGKVARLAAIDACTTIVQLRAQLKDLARVVTDQAREIKRLCRVVGGADRQ